MEKSSTLGQAISNFETKFKRYIASDGNMTPKLQKNKSDSKNKTLKITIPEDLDYTRVFDDIFEEYTKVHELTKVKSTNFGSMFRLTYNITLRDALKEKVIYIDSYKHDFISPSFY